MFRILGIERAWEYLAHPYAQRPRQLFVTKSNLLARKVENDFLDFLKLDVFAQYVPPHFAQRLKRTKSQETETLFTDTSQGGWRKDLPRKYSELTDDHFPLFVTFDEVSTQRTHLTYR